MNLFFLDQTGSKWVGGAEQACSRAGWAFHRIARGAEMGAGLGFIRCSANPVKLRTAVDDFMSMAERGPVVQDQQQVILYDNKWAQAGLYKPYGWLPETYLCSTENEARAAAKALGYPLVLKADAGAASANVRVVRHARGLEKVLRPVFRGAGWPILYCADGVSGRQKGHVIVQRHIPHSVTWRVNAVGNGRAVFQRFNHPARGTAQMGNTQGVLVMDDTVASLLETADAVFETLGTQWCALDFLREGDRWWLLETSLAWPWAAQSKHGPTPIFRTGWTWEGMWDSMLEQAADGVFGALPS